MDSSKYNWKLLKVAYPQYIAAFAATVGLISDGMSYGWTSPIIPILQSNVTPIAIETSDIVWIENIASLGALVGIPFTIYNVNSQGRKISLMVAAVQKLVGWLLIGCSSSLWLLLLGRFLNGFASNAAFVSAPMYIAEMANKRIRGSLLGLVYMMMLMGVLVIYCVGPYTSVLASSLVGAFFVAIQILLFIFIPKSPYFLLMKEQGVNAKKSMEWFQRDDDMEDEFQELTEVVARQQSENGRFVDLFKIVSNRKAVMIMVFLNANQHLSGISVMVMNLKTILEEASSALNPNMAAIPFAILMMTAALSASFLVDIVGRKLLLMVSSFLTSMSLLTLAVYFTLLSYSDAVVTYNWIPVVAVMTYAVAFKCGLGMVPIITTGEIFPTSVKAMGMTVADSAYVMFSFISIYLYQFLVQNYNMQSPFYIFAACSFCSIFFTKFCIPETKGKSLEEIQIILKRRRFRFISTASYGTLE